MKDTHRPKLLTELEVSEWFGIPVATLRSMRNAKRQEQLGVQDPLPFIKHGRLVRYKESDLLKWIERNTFDNATDAKNR